MKSIATLFLMVALSTACSANAKPLTANDTDTGRMIELRVGQRLLLNLGSNPTTGFSWVFDGKSNRILAQEDKPIYQADDKGKGLVGSGGIEHWTFRAIKKGTQTLRLDYRRPWEQVDEPANRVEFPVIVK
ncbi:MAG: protease inhibitor I42 family protein [Candidatus Methylumidiphilus sp.]